MNTTTSGVESKHNTCTRGCTSSQNSLRAKISSSVFRNLSATVHSTHVQTIHSPHWNMQILSSRILDKHSPVTSTISKVSTRHPRIDNQSRRIPEDRVHKNRKRSAGLIWQRPVGPNASRRVPPPLFSTLLPPESALSASHLVQSQTQGEKKVESVSGARPSCNGLSTCRAYGRWRTRRGGTGEIEQEKERM